MLCWIIIILFGFLYTYLFSLLSSNPYMLFLWFPLGFLASLLLFAIFILIFIWLIPYSKQDNKLKHWIVYKLVRFVLTILKIKVEVIGRENIPNDTFVIYGNHKSQLDPVILYSAYHKILSAIAKSDLVGVPFLSRMMVGLGVVALDRNNDREGAKSIVNAIKRVKSGKNYIIFPEGGVKTRDTEHMVALRAGAYKLATKANAIISPVSIIGSSILSKNTPHHFTKVTVIIHKPITPDEYKDYNTTLIGQKIYTIVNDGIEEQKPNTKEFKDVIPSEVGEELES